MTTEIKTESQYRAVMKIIETLLEKTTRMDGLHKLSKDESTMLAELSKVAEAYEDNVQKVMPILPKSA